jgi:hypothetical protein
MRDTRGVAAAAGTSDEEEDAVVAAAAPTATMDAVASSGTAGLSAAGEGIPCEKRQLEEESYGLYERD